MSRSGRQGELFPGLATQAVVNVASVPQRSPFRYPGGKTWLIPHVRRWLKSIAPKPDVLFEPFAGGGIVGLTAAFESLAEHVVMVELDAQVASVWKTILGDDNEWLIDRIMEFDVTTENVISEMSKKPCKVREIAFQTILKNRTFHGGILAPGSSVVRTGENGKGIRSRWYPETLARRISAIATVKDRITFIETDALEILAQNVSKQQAAFFVDPPYTAAGKRAGTRLYRHHQLDHPKLFDLCSQIKGQFLMTYDNADGVRALAHTHKMQTATVPMKGTHNRRILELLISRDLSWL